MSDPVLSADPAVRRLMAKRADIQAEKEQIDRILLLYASHARPIAMTVAEVSAQEHYLFSEVDQCGCKICTEWETRRGELVEAFKLIPKGHKWSTCGCAVCRVIGRIQLNHLAAANRRDLLIETSFHARYHSPFGVQIMKWLDEELCKPNYTDNWCAQEMTRYPLEWWFRKCEAVVGPRVSGMVFQHSMMVTDMLVHFGSSLVADGSYTA